MLYYKQVKVIINALKLVKVILNILVWYYDLFDLILTNKGLLFIFKFWSLLCYLFNIK